MHHSAPIYGIELHVNAPLARTLLTYMCTVLTYTRLKTRTLLTYMRTVLTYTLAKDAYATDIHAYGTDIHVDLIQVTIAL